MPLARSSSSVERAERLHAGAQIAPELRDVARAGEPAGHADDGDCRGGVLARSAHECCSDIDGDMAKELMPTRAARCRAARSRTASSAPALS